MGCAGSHAEFCQPYQKRNQERDHRGHRQDGGKQLQESLIPPLCAEVAYDPVARNRRGGDDPDHPSGRGWEGSRQRTAGIIEQAGCVCGRSQIRQAVEFQRQSRRAHAQERGYDRGYTQAQRQQQRRETQKTARQKKSPTPGGIHVVVTFFVVAVEISIGSRVTRCREQ